MLAGYVFVFKLHHLSLCLVLGISASSISHFIAKTVQGANPSAYKQFLNLEQSNTPQVLISANTNSEPLMVNSVSGDILVEVPDELIQSALADDTGYKQYFLSQVYKEGTHIVPRDLVQYDEWLSLAADKGYEPALYELGLQSKEAFSYPEREQSLSYFARAAKKGHAESQYELALAYYDGDVVDQDYQAAYYWFSKASDKGFADASYAMGLMHNLGKGMPVNPGKAMTLFAKASELDHAEAQYVLGIGYFTGVGVERDYEVARSWLKKSMQGGNVEAWKALRNINVI